MSARPLLTLAACAALLAAAAPGQARPLSAAYEPAPCFFCAPWDRAEPVVVAAPYSQRVVALNEIRRPFTRFDIEALRRFERMP